MEIFLASLLTGLIAAGILLVLFLIVKGPKRFIQEIAWSKWRPNNVLTSSSGLEFFVEGSEQYSTDHLLEFIYNKYPNVDRKFLKTVILVEEDLEIKGKSDYRLTIKELEKQGDKLSKNKKKLVEELYNIKTEYLLLTGLAQN